MSTGLVGLAMVAVATATEASTIKGKVDYRHAVAATAVTAMLVNGTSPPLQSQLSRFIIPIYLNPYLLKHSSSKPMNVF